MAGGLSIRALRARRRRRLARRIRLDRLVGRLDASFRLGRTLEAPPAAISLPPRLALAAAGIAVPASQPADETGFEAAEMRLEFAVLADNAAIERAFEGGAVRLFVPPPPRLLDRILALLSRRKAGGLPPLRRVDIRFRPEAAPCLSIDGRKINLSEETDYDQR